MISGLKLERDRRLDDSSEPSNRSSGRGTPALDFPGDMSPKEVGEFGDPLDSPPLSSAEISPALSSFGSRVHSLNSSDLGSDRQVDVIVVKESRDGSTTVSKGSLIVPPGISLSPDTDFEIAGA